MACAVALAACGQARQVVGETDTASCTRCHGGAADSSGAPPRDIHARSDPSLPSVGAHATHVRALSGAAACKHCHPDPRAGSTAHMNGRVDVVFGTFATAGGALASRFDSNTLSCSAVYCHGAFAGGNAGNAPVWTSVGTGQGSCGTCHGLPPAATHAGVSADATACVSCHAGTVDADGNVLAGGDHVNGRVDGRHDAPWMDPASLSFHGAAAWRGLAICQSCHGLNLDGGSAGVACADCHGSGGQLNCASCHGADPGRGVGAHATHLQALSGDVACRQCHPDPRLGSTEHMDGRVEVEFGTLATHDGALSPQLDPGTLGCSATYCHGAFTGGNAANAPVWTSVGQGQGNCGTCHALPPAATHPGVAADLGGCVRCHASTVTAAGEIVAGGNHVNGVVDGGHADPWMVPTSGDFHGAAAWQSLAMCQACHGQDLAGGVSGVACANCHGIGLSSCASCHRSVPGGDGVRSSHFAGVESPSTNCQTCHDASQLAGGHYRLPVGDPTFPDASCKSCHAGQGQTLGGQTPPLLVGWTDAANGDFHGAREGTGYGGTLKAPYVRAQAPLPCTACHDKHASGNAFLFASTVNGTAIPAGTIDRAGVGGEALCNACHEGERHGTCAAADCHGADPRPPGSACFWCHGHEGIRFWTAPDPSLSMDGTWEVGCAHCHGFGQPPLEYAAPTFSQAPTASSITATTATVRWWTNEQATSYVEYGVGAAGYVAGDAAMAWQHTVTLTGLQPGTPHVWRIRSSDPFRNVTETALQTLTTYAADAVPAPDVAIVVAGTNVPNTTAVATLLWYPVTAPSGTAVEYEIQLAEDPSFTVPPNSTLGLADTSLATANSGWISGTPTQDGSYPPRPAVGFDVTLTNLPQDDCMSVEPTVYYFRVRARDALGKVSDWSATGSFTAMAVDPWC